MSSILSWSRCAATLLLIVPALTVATTAIAQDSVNRGAMEPMPQSADGNYQEGGGAYQGEANYGAPMMDSGPGCACGNGGGDCGGGNCYGGSCDSGYCDNGCCNGGCDCGYCEPARPIRMPVCRQPLTFMYVDWLYLHVGGDDVAHAQQQNGIGGAGTVPFGEIGTLDSGFNSGVRIGGEIACDGCSGVAFNYTYFSSTSTDSLEAPFIPGGG